MWTKIKWGFALILLALVGSVLHYTLPQHDIVRLTRTYNQLTTLGSNGFFYASPDSGSPAAGDVRRDIRFIDAVFEDGSVMVYRNEDTGWIWPPYFKYDSSNLQAEASNLLSGETAPKWIMVTHYGWRMPIFSIYPNAVGLKVVSGPEVTVTPWVNIIVIVALILLVLTIRAMLIQFKQRSIDPVLDEISETFDEVEAKADAAGAGAKGLWARLRGK